MTFQLGPASTRRSAVRHPPESDPDQHDENRPNPAVQALLAVIAHSAILPFMEPSGRALPEDLTRQGLMAMRDEA